MKSLLNKALLLALVVSAAPAVASESVNVVAAPLTYRNLGEAAWYKFKNDGRSAVATVKSTVTSSVPAAKGAAKSAGATARTYATSAGAIVSTYVIKAKDGFGSAKNAMVNGVTSVANTAARGVADAGTFVKHGAVDVATFAADNARYLASQATAAALYARDHKLQAGLLSGAAILTYVALKASAPYAKHYVAEPVRDNVVKPAVKNTVLAYKAVSNRIRSFFAKPVVAVEAEPAVVVAEKSVATPVNVEFLSLPRA